MRHRWLTIFISSTLITLSYSSNPGFTDTCNVEAHFTPTESMQALILQELKSAKHSVHLSLFGIENQALTNQLIKLKQQGIDVRLCVDKRQAVGQGSQISRLTAVGIPVVIKKTGVLEHHKYAIIDNREVIMGSWNWSNSAERQDNSDVIIQNCPKTIQQFEDNFHFIEQRDKLNSVPEAKP